MHTCIHIHIYIHAYIYIYIQEKLQIDIKTLKQNCIGIDYSKVLPTQKTKSVTVEDSFIPMDRNSVM